MYCEVRGCPNSKGIRETEKNPKAEVVKLFPFPRSTLLRETWKWACGGIKDEVDLNGRVCSLHFEPEKFATTEGDNPRTYLKAGSTPTINCRTIPKVKVPIKAVVAKEPVLSAKSNYKLLEPYIQMINDKEAEIKSLKNKLTEERVSTQREIAKLTELNRTLMVKIMDKNKTIQERNQTISDQIFSIKSLQKEQGRKSKKESSGSSEVDKLLKMNILLYKELAETRSTEVVASSSQLEKSNIFLLGQNTHLKKTLKSRELELATVKKFFSPNQLYLLRNPKTRKLCWSKDDMDRAQALYECSSDAYGYLLSMGYPFPTKESVLKWKNQKAARMDRQQDPDYEPQKPKRPKFDMDPAEQVEVKCEIEIFEEQEDFKQNLTNSWIVKIPTSSESDAMDTTETLEAEHNDEPDSDSELLPNVDPNVVEGLKNGDETTSNLAVGIESKTLQTIWVKEGLRKGSITKVEDINEESGATVAESGDVSGTELEVDSENSKKVKISESSEVECHNTTKLETKSPEDTTDDCLKKIKSPEKDIIKAIVETREKSSDEDKGDKIAPDNKIELKESSSKAVLSSDDDKMGSKRVTRLRRPNLVTM